jgi:hypothetical protein
MNPVVMCSSCSYISLFEICYMFQGLAGYEECSKSKTHKYAVARCFCYYRETSACTHLDVVTLFVYLFATTAWGTCPSCLKPVHWSRSQRNCCQALVPCSSAPQWQSFTNRCSTISLEGPNTGKFWGAASELCAGYSHPRVMIWSYPLARSYCY